MTVQKAYIEELVTGLHLAVLAERLDDFWNHKRRWRQRKTERR